MVSRDSYLPLEKYSITLERSILIFDIILFHFANDHDIIDHNKNNIINFQISSLYIHYIASVQSIPNNS